MVEKLFPAFIAFVAQVEVQNRIAFGLNGFLDEFHARHSRSPAAFFGIAFGAGTDDIVPGVAAAQGAGDDVVERQFAGGRFFAAVLAAVTISREDVATVEFNRLLR